MHGAYSTYGEMRNACKISVGKSERKSNLINLGVDGWIILQQILKTKRILRYWIHLAQDSVKWRTVVNM
jgi:hypothetical protein